MNFNYINDKRMALHPLRQKLRTNKKYNPFHDDFDETLVNRGNEKLKEKQNLSEEDALLLSTAESAISLNLAFQAVYKYLRESFHKTNLMYEELVGLSMAIRNRTLWLIHKEHIEQSSLTNEKSFEDSFKRKINSADASIGKLDATAAVETEVDALNTVLNYVRYFKDQMPALNPDIPKLQSIEQLKAQAFTATFYYILKSAYEDSIWRDGFAYFNYDTKELKIEFRDPAMLRNFKVGVCRLQRNAMAFFFNGEVFGR